MPIKVQALDHLVINVADVERAAQWYQRVLGMEVRTFGPGDGKPPRTSLVFGDQKINVRPVQTDKAAWFTADHETAGSDDLCFLTTASPDEVVAHLQACARGDRGRAGRAARRAGRADLGLLPGSGRQPGRDILLQQRNVAS